MPSFFSDVKMGPADPILGVAVAYKADTNPKKVDLGVGAYRTGEGKPQILRAILEAEREVLQEPGRDKEYSPIDGLAQLKPLTQGLVFGTSSLISENRIASVQCLSGTGGLRTAGEFLKTHIAGCNVAYVSKPTWANHWNVFRNSGFEVCEYPYWDESSCGLNVPGMLDTLRTAPAKSVVVLHACAHNPTGMDPDYAEWRMIHDVIREHQLIPLLDSAYQGFASGDLDHDAHAIRMFQSTGELLVTQSFAKNMGLYGERIGMMHVVCESADVASRVLSQLKLVIRPTYSNPPRHGASIVAKVLSTPRLNSMWREELKEMAERIKAMRYSLRAELEKRKTPGTWDHITKQIGMFSYTGLKAQQCNMMTSKWHVYLLTNGRISIAGLTPNNVGQVAEAIDDCVRHASTEG